MAKVIFPYARDSGGPSQERSVKDQQEAIQAWADQRGLVVGRWYIDEAWTGTTEKRSQFQRMITDALREKPYAVVVWDMARFARDQDTAQFYRSLLRRSGVEVLSLTDAIPEGPFSHIFESIIDFGSQHFIHVLSNNVSRGHHKSLSQGFIPGANPPIGYRKVKVEMNERRNGEPRMGVKWEIDEKTAPLVRQAFELRAAGYSTSEIMAKTGLYNSRQGMHHMLRNPIYKGVFVYGDRQYDNLVAPLVDERTWNACQQRRAVHPRTEAGEYLLSGLLRCARCGYAMSGFRTIKRLKNGRVWEKRYYICTNRNARALRDPTRCLAPLVPAAEIEQAVLQIVFSDLLAPEPFRRFRDALRVDEGFDDRAERRSSLDQQIKRLEKANRDLVRLVGLDLEVEEAAETLRQRQAQLAGLRRERAELDDLPPLLTMADDEAIRHIDELAERLRTGTTSVKRWVLQRVIASLSWGPNLKIKFKLPGD